MTTTRPRFGSTALLTLFLLLLPVAAFACGGDDDDGGTDGADPTPETASATEEQADDEPTEDASADTPTPLPSDNVAVVAIGERRYEFIMGNVEGSNGRELMGECLTGLGVISGTGHSPGSNITLLIYLPPEDWQTAGEGHDEPSVRVVDAEDEFDWRAGGVAVPDTSHVDAFTNDGATASGGASFVDMLPVLRGNASGPVEGTFEITCSGG